MSEKENRKLCVACVRKELATMREIVKDINERAEYVDRVLNELINGES